MLAFAMCAWLQVIFRPLRMQHYGDHVELIINNASFQVPVHAYTPATHIEVGARQRHHRTTSSSTP